MIEEIATHRNSTRSVMCGSVTIGGGAPVAVQSMTNTDTRDAGVTAEQIIRLASAGCDIVRCAIPDDAAARAVPEIKSLLITVGVSIPVVADIHFDHRLAISAIENGADKIRINPGNIGDKDDLKRVVDAAGKAAVPMRIGVNSGSVEKDLLDEYGPSADALVKSALRNIKIIEDMDFNDLVVSVKTSSVKDTITAYRLLSEHTDHPLHLGVTEAGAGGSAVVKSAIGIGSLLADGIGDTIRVSLTGDPVNEITAARDILAGLGLLPGAIDIISCPTCGRCHADLEKIVNEVYSAIKPIEAARCDTAESTKRLKPISLAIMGCSVNGPGEAAHADMGVACGRDGAVWFEKGKTIRHITIPEIVPTIIDALNNCI